MNFAGLWPLGSAISTPSAFGHAFEIKNGNGCKVKGNT